MPKTERNTSRIILVNDDGCILMQHRDDDSLYYPGYWTFFGGGIEKNENPEKTIKREMLEEICYTLTEPQQILCISYDNEKNFGKKYYFIDKYDPNQKIEQKEGQEYAWISLEDLSKYKISKDNLKLIEQIRSKVEAYKTK